MPSMRTSVNVIAFLLALTLAIAVGLSRHQPPQSQRDGAATVLDATGVTLPIGSAQRIVSVSILSDRLLTQLVAPQRVVAMSTWSQGDWTLPLAGVSRLRGAEEVEAILALDSDLVLVAGGLSPAVQRLREAGIAVYCLGDLDGWVSCQRILADIGRLTASEAAAARLLATAEARLAVLRQAWPTDPERTVYVSVHDTQLHGGTVGTGYHDVLRLAGCIDAAAERFSGWPTLSVEDLYALAPTVIVTASGGAERLRRLIGVERLAARIVEVPSELIHDPGLGIVDAAIALRAALTSK